MKSFILYKNIVNIIVISLLCTSLTYSFVNDSSVQEFSTSTVIRGYDSDKYFVVVIPSYNNKEWYERNLGSVFSQNYKNFEVIYTDDNSEDGTGDLAEEFIQKMKPTCKVTLIKNSKRCGALENIYRSIYSSRSDAIIVTLDGDDWFPHNEVLSKLNKVYADPNVWVTYGQFEQYPSHEIGWCTPMPKDIVEHNAYRDYQHIPSHLRTFYAWLFHHIKLEDLLYEGTFFSMTWDMAFMMPMMEMAAGRFKFISDVVYTYNMANPINDHKISKELQRHLDLVIRAKARYAPLNEPKPRWEDAYKRSMADIVIYSQDRPLQLYGLLESIKVYAKGLHNIYIIYRTSDDKYVQAYQSIRQQFPYVTLVKYDNQKGRFKKLLMHYAFKSSNNYVLFTSDAMVLTDYVDINQCIQAMEKTHAYTFNLSLGNNLNDKIPTSAHIKDDIYGRQFVYGEKEWQYLNECMMTIYRKTDIKKRLQEIDYQSIKGVGRACLADIDLNKIGLFYEHSRAVHASLTDGKKNNAAMLARKLLRMFNRGLKLNITSLFHINNPSMRILYKPTFIKR